MILSLRRPATWPGMIAVILLLSGCNTTVPLATLPTTATAGDGLGSATATTSNGSTTRALAPGDGPAKSVAPALFTAAERDPARLMNLAQQDLTHILGTPGYQRREAGAKVWQYQTASCVLDVFLYAAANTFRVTYFEFRPADSQAIDSQACFEELLRQQRVERPGSA